MVFPFLFSALQDELVTLAGQVERGGGGEGGDTASLTADKEVTEQLRAAGAGGHAVDVERY